MNPIAKIACSIVPVLMFMAAPVRASLIVSISPNPVMVNAGTNGDFFDVILANTGPSAVTIGGFSFGLSVTNTNIVFTSATTATVAAPYIFAGNSLFGPTISTVPPPNGQNVTASDVDSSPSGAVVASGATVGLGHVLFNILPGASSGQFTVTFGPSPAVTSLSDANGNNIPITTVNNGTITINGTTTPEPSTVLLALAGFALIGVSRARRK